MQLQTTRAILLRTVAYGETSLVVTAFTEVYGLQSYMVKGARTSTKKGQSLRPYLQPAAILDLVVYHHPGKNLQFIREMRWSKIYQQVLTSVLHHSVAQYMVELLTKCLKHPEANTDLFETACQYLELLDAAEPGVLANLPIHFALKIAGQLGFMPENNYEAAMPVFDLQEGRFTAQIPAHQHALTDDDALHLHLLLNVDNPVTLYRVKLNRRQRQVLLDALEMFYGWHVADFGTLRSRQILETLF